MRLTLAILALVSLILTPAVTLAAELACPHGLSVAAAGEMTGMTGLGKTQPPCCDQQGKSQAAKICSQACAMIAATAVAPLNDATSVPFLAVSVAKPPALEQLAQPFEPPALERPPRSIA